MSTLNRPIFTMLVGIPGSGKSTFAKTMITKYAKHITSDCIRKELWGDESSQQDNNKVFSVSRINM